jgi:predicted secreted hydrolase
MNPFSRWSLKRRFLELIVGGIILSLFWGWPHRIAADEWMQAKAPWKWSFPRDHGAHPDFRTEWWYFTGNLQEDTGNRFGYQLTFFRQGVLQKAKNSINPWSIRDLYLAHFSLTDVSADRFWYAERISRKGPGLADASERGLDVRLLNWTARMEEGRIRIGARHQQVELSLELSPRKPIVFHGQNGLSRKGPREGQASYYTSFTDLSTKGVIRPPSSPSAIHVKGTSWFDQEFGSNQLASNQVGWDWFSLHLSDGKDLMIYFLRRTGGSLEPTSSGTLVDPAGKTTHLRLSDINVEVLDHWKSPKTGGRYPNRWRIRVPNSRIELLVNPLVAAQELITESSTGVVYWEGAVAGKGKSSNRDVNCEGYVEMTGYAGALGGLF